MAERTRSIDVIHFSAKAVIRADLLFTLPGVLLVLMNGYAMVLDRWGGWGAFHQLSWITRQLQKIFIGESVQPDIHALSWPMWHVVQVHHL